METWLDKTDRFYFLKQDPFVHTVEKEATHLKPGDGARQVFKAPKSYKTGLCPLLVMLFNFHLWSE